MSPAQPPDELADLLSSLIDGTLSDSEHQRLEGLLASDADARAFYRDYMRMVAGIHWRWHGTGSVAPEESAPRQMEAGQDASRRSAPGQSPRLWGAKVLLQEYAQQPVAAAILLIAIVSGGILAWNLSQAPPQPRLGNGNVGAGSNEPRANSSRPSVLADASAHPLVIVAQLKETRDATWGETAWKPGSQLHAGQRLSLKRGLAEIVFESGATVVLEGPAEFEVGSRKSEVGMEKGNQAGIPHSASPVPPAANSCSLTLGKLVARVPKQAQGFTVHTPTMKIVDLGTEFAVQVNAEVGKRITESIPHPASPIPHSTEVHVLNGEVRVTPEPGSVAQGSSILANTLLKAGEALASEPGGAAPRVIQVEPGKFVRELPTEGLTAKVKPGDTGWKPMLQPGDILAVSRYALKLVKIDPKTGEQTLLVQGDRGAHGTDWMCAAVDSRQRVLIGVGGLGLAPEGAGGVVRFDPQSGKLDVLAHEGLLAKGRINSLAVAADGAIFASLTGTHNQIVRIDPETGAAKRVADFGSNAWGIAIDTDGRSLLAASDGNGGEVARIQDRPVVQGSNVETWAKGAMVDGARGIAVLPGGRALVSVSYVGAHSMVEIDRQSHRPTRLGTLSEAFEGILGMMAVQADGSLIVGTLLSDSGNVYRFDVSEGKFALLSSKGHLAHCGGVAVVPGGTTAEKVEPKP